MPTNDLPSLTYDVVRRMCTRISWRLMLLSSRVDIVLFSIHVFQWVVGIRELLHAPHICALLQILEVPHKYWPLVVESTVRASVNAF